MTRSSDGRRLRLLVIANPFEPDVCGGAPIFTDMCRGLGDRGMDVTVRCTYPYFPEYKDKSGKNGFRIERTRESGLLIERYGLFIPSNPQSIWQRLLHEGSFFLSLCRSLPKSGGFDAVVVICPLMGNAVYAMLQKLIFGTPILLNIQDLPADAAAAAGIARGRGFTKALRWLQGSIFNRGDVWRSISPVMINQLNPMRRRNQPLVLIPDWLHPSMSVAIRSIPSKLGRPPGDPVRLLYSGNIGGKQGLLKFCKILAASEALFEFQINGAGGGAEQISEWINSSGDTRFRIGPLVDEEGFVRAMHDADLFVITEKPDKRASFFPNKTIPAMTSGTPILAISSGDSPLGREIRDHGVGPCFSWEDAGDVGAMLASLSGSREVFRQWQDNAIRRASFYDRERCISLFEDTIRNLVRDPEPADLTAPASGEVLAGNQY